MKESRAIPAALQIVAILFLLAGIGSAVGMVGRLFTGHERFDLGIFGIPASYGLRRFSTGWRTFALGWIWRGLIVAPVMFALALFCTTPLYMRIFGVKVAEISFVWVSVVSVPFFLLELWQYRVLTRPQIRAFFVTPLPPNPEAVGRGVESGSPSSCEPK